MEKIQRKTEISLSNSLKNSIFIKKDMMMEIFKDIEGYEGLYEVSNYGRVRSFDRWVIGKSNSKRLIKGKILKPGKNEKGYLGVNLFKNGRGKMHRVHRLVARAFINNPDNYKEINHKNEVKTDNRVENLEWCDRKYNINYGTRIEKISKKVLQYTLDGEFVKEWKSLMEIKRSMEFSVGNIGQCCLDKRKTAYNYIWKYA